MMRMCGRRAGKAELPSGWVMGFWCVVTCACVTREHPPSGPPPEYIPPRVLAWDASSSDTEDPFAAAAAGDWLPQQEAANGAEDAAMGAADRADSGDGGPPAPRDAGRLSDGEGSPLPRTDTADAGGRGTSPTVSELDGGR